MSGPQRGTHFAANVEMFNSPLSIPCLKPPYGEIAVVDIITQEIVCAEALERWTLGYRALLAPWSRPYARSSMHALWIDNSR